MSFYPGNIQRKILPVLSLKLCLFFVECFTKNEGNILKLPAGKNVLLTLSLFDFLRGTYMSSESHFKLKLWFMQALQATIQFCPTQSILPSYHHLIRSKELLNIVVIRVFESDGPLFCSTVLSIYKFLSLLLWLLMHIILFVLSKGNIFLFPTLRTIQKITMRKYL